MPEIELKVQTLEEKELKLVIDDAASVRVLKDRIERDFKVCDASFRATRRTARPTLTPWLPRTTAGSGGQVGDCVRRGCPRGHRIDRTMCN